jgi:hypothetical protein
MDRNNKVEREREREMVASKRNKNEKINKI